MCECTCHGLRYHICTFYKDFSRVLIKFAVKARAGTYSLQLMFQLKLIGVCASLILRNLHAEKLEWPDDVARDDVAKVGRSA